MALRLWSSWSTLRGRVPSCSYVSGYSTLPASLLVLAQGVHPHLRWFCKPQLGTSVNLWQPPEWAGTLPWGLLWSRIRNDFPTSLLESERTHKCCSFSQSPYCSLNQLQHRTGWRHFPVAWLILLLSGSVCYEGSLSPLTFWRPTVFCLTHGVGCCLLLLS